MVSKARLDLPEPERPVTTTSWARGISSETFLRLWTRAPWTAILVRAEPFRVSTRLEGIRRALEEDERQLLHFDVALLREMGGRGDLADEPLVGEVLARGDHAAGVVVLLEVILDFLAGSRLAGLAE